ncbi:hypothetical protein [Salinigranum marinum]|uniref:hypothetical protein n=1 Tax=Salinigranum marinum TaxID=1515595 RepID=UPI002989C115|nr:hypothetical protein [Salinigranum marinum]
MNSDSSPLGSRLARGRWLSLRAAASELLSREFAFSTGHLTAFLSGCLFAPSLLTFWFINGVLDFSTALVLGAVVSPAGLQLRVVAYLLLVPTFLALRAGFHLAHPVHRQQVLSGSCPRTELLSLDWFSVGILATGLPLSLQALGPWIGMNLVFVVGLLVLPQFASPRAASGSKLSALVGGPLLFVYAKYGGSLPVLPDPAGVLGPVATVALSDATTGTLLAVVNSLLPGPVLIGVFAVATNHVLTHPEIRAVPVVRHTLPDCDPDRTVFGSAALGTVFYLLVVAGATGTLTVIPS